MNSQRALTTIFVFCVCWAILGCGWVEAQNPDQRRILFTNLSSRQGLAEGEIHQILQDYRGQLWFVQEGGMARFDGYALRPFKGPNALYPSGWKYPILALAEDADGWFWIGTAGGGLLHFHPDTAKMSEFREKPEHADALSSDTITSLLRDSAGNLWVGTDSGLNRLDTQTQLNQQVFDEKLDRRFIVAVAEQSGQIWVATKAAGLYRRDHEGAWKRVWNPRFELTSIATEPNALWLGTVGEGVIRFDTRAHVTDQFLPEKNGLLSRDVLSLWLDSRNGLWAGTPRGLNRMNLSTGKCAGYTHHILDDHSLAPGEVTAIFEDELRNVLWVGTRRGNVSHHPLNQHWFPHFQSIPGNERSLTDNAVYGMAESGDGRIWIGTENGLNRFDPQTGFCEQFRHDPEKSGGLPHPYIYAVLEDRRGWVWLGTRGGGLIQWNPETGEFRQFRHDPEDIASLPGDSVSALYEDRQGRIWIAVPGQGLAFYDEGIDSFQLSAPEFDRNAPRFVHQLHEDWRGRLWVAASDGGLWLLDAAQGTFVNYRHLPGVTEKLPFESVYAVTGGRNRNLWLGTERGGFSSFVPETGKFEHFTKTGGETDYWGVRGLVEDAENKLWIANDAGLARFDPVTGAIRHFTVRDGVQSASLHSQALLKASDGMIYAGGAKGFNRINITRLPAKAKPPKPLLTELRFNGEPVLPSPGGLLERPLASLLNDPLRLPYHRKMRFAIRFGTLSHSRLESSFYRYRLEGFDEIWLQADENRTASYPALRPGKYELNVEMSTDGDRWIALDHPLKIVIVPPWYRTTWAVLLFGLVGVGTAGGGIFTAYRLRLNREVRHREQLENERNRAEAALARQIQYSMLLERTNAEFRRNLNSTHVFTAALQRLGEHFGINRCFVAAVSGGTENSAEPDEDSAQTLEILAEFLDDGYGSQRELDLPPNHPIVQAILSSEHPVAFENTDPDEPKLSTDARSILAIRTAHQEQPNGLIVLQQCDGTRFWHDEEIQLLESVADQLGIAIAQFLLSQKEARQAQELEQARREAEAANQAKSDFLAKMTHELRTPLSAIIGFSEMMGRDDTLNEGQSEHVGIINSSGEHLLGVINDVLEVSKIEAGKSEVRPERVDLEGLLKSAYAMLSGSAREKGVELAFAAKSTLPKWVETDKNKVRQILINLLNNAIKFTNEGGVNLKVGANYLHEEVREPSRFPLILQIEVEDSGPGISDEDLPHLFQRFVQTNCGKSSGQGTGLGLAIVKGFAEMMGGGVSVYSKVEEGSTFTVRLPMVQLVDNGAGEVEAANHGREVIGLAPGQRKIRVLLADDQPMNRLLMRKFLHGAGFTLEEAEDGREAVEKWRDWRPDIIFMDEDMPHLRGTEATRRIAEEAAGQDMPVIVSLTAYALEDQRIAALDAGCADFLAKPFKRSDLFEVIARHLPVEYEYREEVAKAA